MPTAYFLDPPTIQETPAAWDNLFVRYGIHRGITIVQRMDDTFYTTRYPAQTELEEVKRFWLGGYHHEIDESTASALTDAGYGEYITTEEIP